MRLADDGVLRPLSVTTRTAVVEMMALVHGPSSGLSATFSPDDRGEGSFSFGPFSPDDRGEGSFSLGPLSPDEKGIFSFGPLSPDFWGGEGEGGLMQWPEFRRIGFAGKTKICCAPPYQS